MMEPFRAKTDEMLLAATAGGDSEAFATFYRRHEDAMLLFFLRRTGDAETAADLAAEVFAGALASAARFRRAETPAVAWLYGIANHKLSTSRRRGRVEDRARRRLRLEPLALTDDALERVEALADSDRSSRVLAKLLSELPPEQHAAVRERVLEDRPYLEIASELKCSPALIRKRVSRGLKTLRVELSKELA